MVQILNQVGRFKARVISSGMQSKEGAKSWSAVIKFSILAAWNDASQAWDDWSGYEPQEKTAFLNIIKKDGEINDVQAKAFAASFGWDGDFAKLEHLEAYDKVVQITLAENEWEGQKSIVVKWVNPENYEGFQTKPVESTKLKSLNAQYGAKLRAILPRQAAATTAARPATPAPKPLAQTRRPAPAPAPAPAPTDYGPNDGPEELDIPEENIPI